MAAAAVRSSCTRDQDTKGITKIPPCVCLVFVLCLSCGGGGGYGGNGCCGGYGCCGVVVVVVVVGVYFELIGFVC